MRSKTGFTRRLAVGGILAAGLITAAPASAQTGGSAAPGSVPPASSPTVPGGKAKLLKNGKAVAPAGAPAQVVAAIEAGNRIRKKPYRYGGKFEFTWRGGVRHGPMRAWRADGSLWCEAVFEEGRAVSAIHVTLDGRRFDELKGEVPD